MGHGSKTNSGRGKTKRLEAIALEVAMTCNSGRILRKSMLAYVVDVWAVVRVDTDIWRIVHAPSGLAIPGSTRRTRRDGINLAGKLARALPQFRAHVEWGHMDLTLNEARVIKRVLGK